MEKDKIYYYEKIKIDSRKLEELRTDRENLEKFAREQYLMKKDNEDIFIVKDEQYSCEDVNCGVVNGVVVEL